MGRGQAQNSQVRTLGPKGVSRPLCQRLSIQISWTCKVRFILAFVFRCIMFISASYVIGLGLEVEAFGKPLYGKILPSDLR